MTGIRHSFAFRLESEFGKDPTAKTDWIAPPPGSFMSISHSRKAAPIRTAGHKQWDTVAYGSLSGSFSWTFQLDYQYMEPFTIFFEGYEPPKTGQAYHLFKKLDNKRTKSFQILGTCLNIMAGGASSSDEKHYLTGCVMRTLAFSKGTDASTCSVTINGFFAKDYIVTGDFTWTDWQPYDGTLVEHLCMCVNDASTKGQPYDPSLKQHQDGDAYPDGGANAWDGIGIVQSLQINISNNTNPLYSTCGPFAVDFYEGYSDYKFAMDIYSRDPNYKKRLYGGGTPVPATSDTKFEPHRTQLAPLHNISLKSSTGETVPNCEKTQPVDTAGYGIEFYIRDCVVNSLTWQKGDGSELMDTLNSADCRYMEIRLYNPTNASEKIPSWTSFDPTGTAGGKAYGATRSADATIVKKHVVIDRNSWKTSVDGGVSLVDSKPAQSPLRAVAPAPKEGSE